MRIDNSIFRSFMLESYMSGSNLKISSSHYKSLDSSKDISLSNQSSKVEYIAVSYSFKALEISLTKESINPEGVEKKEIEAPKWYELKKESDRMYALFIKYLEDLLEKQVEKDQELKIKKFEELRLRAQKAISENGYWGAKAVAKRILDFAKSISNGDPSKISLLRDAVEKAFKEVKEKLGGWLPEVSKKTYELVMKGFEEWEETAQGSVEDIPDTVGTKT